MRRVGMIWVMLCLAMTSFAQRAELSKTEQESVKKRAIQKVKTFQESCRKIADTHVAFWEKTCEGGMIEVTMQDFMDDAKIRITSLDGRSFSEKGVKQYLKRLALLSKNTYKEIDITSFDCSLASDFRPDPNRGEGWYVGEVKVTQIFRALRKGEYNVEVTDKVVRTTKVYAKKSTLIVNQKNVPYWDVKLGDIKARNID